MHKKDDMSRLWMIYWNRIVSVHKWRSDNALVSINKTAIVESAWYGVVSPV